MRVRSPKSEAEAQRYSLANCAVEAKLVLESSGRKKKNETTAACHEDESSCAESPALVKEEKDGDANYMDGASVDESQQSSDDDDDESVEVALSNRFSALV